MSTIAQAIERLQAYPPDKACAMCLWLPEDALSMAEQMGLELSEKDADEIMHVVDRRQDAGIGITWDVLESYIWSRAQKLKEEESTLKPESET